MNGEFTGLLWGALGGGAVALVLRTVERALIDVHIAESIEARQKVQKYAKPFWLACNDLEWRFSHILEKLTSGGDLNPLRWSPEDATPVRWYVENGYYVTSTAYLLANVAAWIRLFQRDVVFLRFRKNSATAQFFRLVESLKAGLSKDPPSILWYHYFNGIGEYLIDADVPMSIAAFTNKLATDERFRAYYGQLFRFLHRLASKDHEQLLRSALSTLREIKQCLEKNGAVPEISTAEPTAQNETKTVRRV
jgi:hypothetical protein